MTDTIVLLQLEHGHIARLLSILEDQCRRLQKSGAADLELVEAALDYFADYPDTCHHPKEDRVFRRLTERDPDRAQQLVDLLAEHDDVSTLTQEVLGHVRQARANGAKGELVLGLRRFIHRYREHLEAEERHFFPAVLSSLTDEDWAAIDFDVFDRHDPLFDTATEARYVRLRHLIQGMAPPRPDGD